MTDRLIGIALRRAFAALARAASRGPVSAAKRAKIEAEEMGVIDQVLETDDEFSFSVPRALEVANFFLTPVRALRIPVFDVLSDDETIALMAFAELPKVLAAKAYVDLAVAAELGQVGEGARAKIKAEALGVLSELKKLAPARAAASHVFVENAASELDTLFAIGRTH